MASQRRLLCVASLAVGLAGLIPASASAAAVCSASTPQYCPAPVVTTGTATSITTSSATLNGTVNPAGTATSCAFAYGTTTTYGKATTLQSVGSGTSTVNVSAPITGLTANTTYHFILVCANAGIVGSGGDKTFTTLAVPKSRVAIAKRNEIVSKTKGIVKFVVQCKSTVRCVGKLSLTSLGGARFAPPKNYSIAGHRSKTISMKLTKKALKKLKAAKHHRMKARAKAVDRDGSRATRVVTLILHK